MESTTDTTLDEPVIVTTATGETYRATVEEGMVTIAYEVDERWRLAGKGTWDGSEIADCNADLGDDGYELLNAAIAEAAAE